MNKRYAVLIAIFLIIIGAVVGRLVYLQLVDQQFLQQQGAARTTREVKMAAYRGMITDRNGEALAISTPVDSVWVNPQLIEPADPQLGVLAKLLQLPVKTLRKKITDYCARHKEFLFIKRHIEPKVSQKVLALNMPGVHLIKEYRRFYPNADVTAQLLGVTDIDDHGQEGLELAYNSWLEGKLGKKRVIKDLHGHEVEDLGVLKEAQSGHDLALSIDQRLQYLAYRELQNAIAKHHAVSGSIVVLDVHTGEVLAMANNPSFNPNQRTRHYDPHVYRNAAVTDAFEPGSVFKPLSLASVFEHTKVTQDTLVDTKPGYLRLRGGVVRDRQNNGVLDVASVMRESSNIGISKLVLNLSPNALMDTYSRFGFGWSTNSGFPGENAGAVTKPGADQPFVLATLSFGYGVSVTPLQLAQAYAIIGADGIKYPVSFVKIEESPAGERVLSPKVARQVLDVLSYSVEHNNSNARVPGYHVAGKTGTARIAEQHGYAEKKYRAVFAGLAPAINPRVAIVVAINEPRAGEYYSNQVAAPVFAKVAGGALRLFKIAPDLLDTHGVQVAQNGNAG